MRSLRLAAVFGLITAAGCQRRNPAFEELASHPPGEKSDAGEEPVGDASASSRPVVGDARLVDAPGAGPGRPDVPLADAEPTNRSPDLLAAGVPDEGPRSPVVACPSDPDLLLCLRFEGAVRDESPYGRAFMVSEVEFVPSPDGLALSHRPASRVRWPNATAVDVARLTLEAWVNPRTLPAGAARAAIVDYQREYSLFIYPDGSARCGANTGEPTPGEVRAAGAVRPGVWTSLACTADNNRIAIWVNGVMRASQPLPTFLAFGGSPGGLFIGANVPTSGSDDPGLFDGLIDNVRIWRRIRTSDEICASAVGCVPR